MLNSLHVNTIEDLAKWKYFLVRFVACCLCLCVRGSCLTMTNERTNERQAARAINTLADHEKGGRPEGSTLNVYHILDKEYETKVRPRTRARCLALTLSFVVAAVVQGHCQGAAVGLQRSRRVDRLCAQGVQDQDDSSARRVEVLRDRRGARDRSRVRERRHVVAINEASKRATRNTFT